MQTPQKICDRFTGIAQLHAVVTVVHEVRLPAVGGPSNVVAVPWGDAKRRVLESLLECAKLHGINASKTTKRHAGRAQGVLEREIFALPSSALARRPLGLFVAPPFQRVSEFLKTLRVGEVWPDVAS